MTKTKLVFTLGPSTDAPGVLRQLIEAGMSTARFNFSHGSQDDHARRFAALKKAARQAGKSVAVMMDLAGPKLRIGRLPSGNVTLIAGELVRLTPATGGTKGGIPVTLSGVAQAVRPGDPVLLDDGALRLRVVRTQGRDVICRVETGGRLLDHKGVNLPKVAMNLPALTAKDRADLAFGLKLGMDYVALSFVRRPEDIRQLRRTIRRLGGEARIIAKIEKPQAIPCLAEILQAADGLMVARGDLGVEMEPEQVPILQKQIIQLANRFGKPVITATQMLQSMIDQPSPTRAEASDVANAIFDGTDAIMLSGETAAGHYPVAAATMMRTIAQRAEASPQYNRLLPPPPLDGHDDVIVSQGVVLAEKIGAQALVIFTHSGRTAQLASRQRPRVAMLALAHDPAVRRRLQLCWGVQSANVRRGVALDAVAGESEKALRRLGLVTPGGFVIILASSRSGGGTDVIKVHKQPG